MLDLLLAVGIGAFGVWREQRSVSPPHLIHAPLWCYVAAQILGAAALLRRRRSAFRVGALTAALNVLTPVQSTVVAVYSAAVHGQRRAGTSTVVALLFGTYCVGGLIWTLDDPYSAPLALALATALGCYVATRRRLVDALVDRARRVERERHLLADRAVARERDRLGRQMHDVITHRLSLLVLQAGALEMAATDDELRRQAEQLRQNGVDALTELNAVFSTFGTRTPVDEEADPQVNDMTTPAGADSRPGDLEAECLAAFDTLVEQWRQVGVDVELDRHDAAADLGGTVQRAVYRVLTEAMANAVKHAPGSVVRGVTSVADGRVHVQIRSTAGVRGEHPLRSTGRGSGLAGLHERLSLLGGDLEHGPTDDHGYLVKAWLPTDVPGPGAR